MKELYWKDGQVAQAALPFWEDTLRYLYLPRLKSRDVLARAIRSGASSRDFFATAYGQNAGTFVGFQFGSPNMQLDDTLLLIEPVAACGYEAALRPVPQPSALVVADPRPHAPTPSGLALPSPPPSTAAASHVAPPPARSRSFHGAAEVTAATSTMRLVQLAEEIIAVLSSDPNATGKVVLEISAEFFHGAPDPVKRAVSENARSLGMKTADWK